MANFQLIKDTVFSAKGYLADALEFLEAGDSLSADDSFERAMNLLNMAREDAKNVGKKPFNLSQGERGG